MSSTIAAITTGTGGVITTADNSGNLNLVSGTTTIVAVTATGAAVTGTLSSTTGVNLATSSGSVGIGTASPAQKLDVIGNVRVGTSTYGTTALTPTGWGYGPSAYPVVMVGQASGNSTVSIGYDPSVNANGSFTGSGGEVLFRRGVQFVTPNAANTLWNLLNLVLLDGNVGIGTSTPSAVLHLNKASGAADMRFSVGGTLYANIYASSSDTSVFSVAATPLLFGTNNTEAMRIDSSGNVLAGTTSTDISAVGIRLMNNNQLQTSKSGDWSLRMGRRDSTGIIAEIYYNSSRVGDIATNGTTTSYNTSSDYRLKNTIAPMTGALAKVAALKPCTYKWNVDGSDGQGFIAHELDAVVPGCVTGAKDATREEEYEVSPAVPAVVDAEGVETTPAVQAVKGTRTVPSYQGVDTSFLVATLTAAIQELKAIIDTQAAQITALNAKVGI